MLAHRRLREDNRPRRIDSSGDVGGGETPDQIEAEFAGKGYKEFKAALAERVVAILEPIQRRYDELTADPATLDALLAEGAARVRPLAQRTVRTVKERVGLL